MKLSESVAKLFEVSDSKEGNLSESVIMTKDEYDNISTIDLADEIRKYTDVDVSLARVDLSSRGVGSFESNNLSDRAGIAKVMFKKLIVRVVAEKLDNESIYFDVSFRYDHPSGGSNGYNIATLWKMKNGIWNGRSYT